MPRGGTGVQLSSRRLMIDERRDPFNRQLNSKFKSPAFSLLLFVVLAIGCGSADGVATGEAQSLEVEPASRIFDRSDSLSGDDLVTLGLKSGKKYDVSTLFGGVEARLFFWRVQDKAVEYEARFYASHADAIDLGTVPAEEGSGEDAVLDVDKAEYKEGVKDRRSIFDFRGTIKPKYGAYAIYDNMVVLCEGRDDEEAWDRCTALIEALDNR